MNIKFKGLVLGTALSALAFSACQTTSNTNVNVTTANRNTAVVVNDNTNAVITSTNTNRASTNANWNANITREEYNRDRARYEAEKGASSIGQGANDSWIWVKTRAALATTEELRDSTINVDVENDVVTLRGTVANAAQKSKAEQVAKGIQGVKQVKSDQLKVSAGDSITNTRGGNTANTNKK